MEFAEVIDSMQVVEVTAESRIEALGQMVAQVEWGDPAFRPEELLAAIEDREAAAQTVVAPGFAIPHALVNWSERFRVILGRSRNGIEFGIPDTGRVHLVALLAVSRSHVDLHLELMATVANLLRSPEFRDSIVAAPSTAAIRRLIEQRGCPPRGRRGPRPCGLPQLNAVLVGQAVKLAESLSAQSLLVAVDHLVDVPWQTLADWDGRLLIVTAESAEGQAAPAGCTRVFWVSRSGLSRMDRANLGLLLAAASGILEEDAWVVCVAGPEGAHLDSLTVVRPEPHWHLMFSRSGNEQAQIQPEVLLRLLSLAIEMAAEGREGRPIGTMFVVGDSSAVLNYARQLVLNPFHGFAASLRNVLDPSLAETIKEFAQIDGAFIVQGDGTVVSAGSYLAPAPSSNPLPQGLGTRHSTAAAITNCTESLAVTVSQSTGTVTVFRKGAIVLKLERAEKTRW